MVHQNTPHQPRGKTVKMFPGLTSQAALANQLQKKFVHHARRLQHVLRPLAAKQRPCNLPQLRIHQLEQMFRRGGLSLTPLAKKHRNFTRLRQETNLSWGETVVYTDISNESRNLCWN